MNQRPALEMIAVERNRQIEKEGYDSDHDDAHTSGELAMAAACYAAPVPIHTVAFCGDGEAHDAWPFDEDLDTREDHDDLRRLVIAGALLVAEIERLQRVAARED
jgi:hypothetical protein